MAVGVLTVLLVMISATAYYIAADTIVNIAQVH